MLLRTLDDTAWSIADVVGPIGTGTHIFAIDFTSKDQQYSCMQFIDNTDSGELYFGDTLVYTYPLGGWANAAYQKVAIAGGVDATDPMLLAWFKTYAKNLTPTNSGADITKVLKNIANAIASGGEGGGVPAIEAGDAGKLLVVNGDESGVEWADNVTYLYLTDAPSGGYHLYKDLENQVGTSYNEVVEMLNGPKKVIAIYRTAFVTRYLGVFQTKSTAGLTKHYQIWFEGQFDVDNETRIRKIRFDHTNPNGILSDCSTYDYPIYTLLEKNAVESIPTRTSDLINDGTGSAPFASFPTITNEDAGKVLKVNNAATGVEWGADESGNLPAIGSGDAGKVLTVNAGETGAEWATPSAGSGIQQLRDGSAGEVFFCMPGSTPPVGYWQPAVQLILFDEQYLGVDKVWACSSAVLATIKSNTTLAGYLPVARVRNLAETEIKYLYPTRVTTSKLYFYDPLTTTEYEAVEQTYNEQTYIVLEQVAAAEV